MPTADGRPRGGRCPLTAVSSFLRDAEDCFPVVGGALVIEDIGHLTRTFSRTLGPYLARAITPLRTQRAP